MNSNLTEVKQAFDAAQKKQVRQFAIAVGGSLALVFGLLLPWIWNAAHLPWWPWAAGSGLVILAWVAPRAVAPVQRQWMRLGHVLGRVNTRIVLTIIYALVIVPAGFVMRLVSYDPMQRGFDRRAKTYRRNSQAAPREQMERPF